MMKTLNPKSDIKSKIASIVSLVYIFITIVGIGFYLTTNNSVIIVIAGSLMAVLPVPLYIFGVFVLDRGEPEPKILLLLVFIWGATIAAFISLVLNTIVGHFVGLNISAILGAPIIEEVTKGVAIFMIFFFRRKNLNSVLDGVVYGAMVGLGFAMTENIFYYVRSLSASGVTGGLNTFFSRSILTPYIHPIFTMMTGMGFAISVNTKNNWMKRKAPILGISIAILFHSMWNGSALLGEHGIDFIYYLLFIPMLVTVIITTRIWETIFKKEKKL